MTVLEIEESLKAMGCTQIEQIEDSQIIARYWSGSTNFEYELTFKVNQAEYFEVTVNNWNGINPFSHIDPKTKNVCLDNTLNSYATSFAKLNSNHFKNLKSVLDDQNEFLDSFNDFNINCNNRGIRTFFLYDIHELKEKSIVQKEIIRFSGNDLSNFPKWIQKELRGKEEFILWITTKNSSKKIGIIVISGELHCIKDFRHVNLIAKTGANPKDDLVIIFGLGSLGSEVFEQKRLAGYKRFILCDHDTLENSNVFRYSSSVTHGVKKVQQLKSKFGYLRNLNFPFHDPRGQAEFLKIDIIDNKNFQVQMDVIKHYITQNNIRRITAVDATATDEGILKTVKILENLSVKSKILSIFFMERNGAFAHIFQKENEKIKVNVVEKFLEDYPKLQGAILRKEDIFDEGCVGETQIYSQNSSKYFAMKQSIEFERSIMKNEAPFDGHKCLTSELFDYSGTGLELTEVGKKYVQK